MHFLHEGRPQIVRQARWTPPARTEAVHTKAADLGETLLKILASPNVCSKEWIVRQYDHEVQGGTIVKPLVGAGRDGPGDAAVVLPVLGSWRGLAVGCGINPRLGDLDPYRMAACVLDEAVRNVVAVGADPGRIALLDNFCWGNTERTEVLGSLVLACEACRDFALAYGMPFISGKDSLHNEFRHGERTIVIPPTLLIRALGLVPDVRHCVTMDFKSPGNMLYAIGETKPELGGSHYHMVNGSDGGVVPQPDRTIAPRIFTALHRAISSGLVRSCHDLSEGGLAVALAEMAFAGDCGADVTGLFAEPGSLSNDVALFAESCSRFVVEIEPVNSAAIEGCFRDLPCRKIGQTTRETRLRIAGANGEWIIWAKLADLKEAWQKTLRQ